MKGYSIITYKGQTIHYIDYSEISKKEEVFQLIDFIINDWETKKLPPHSVLSLTNVTNLKFDMDILSKFKKAREKWGPYEKKVAMIGVAGLIKAGYNFVMGITNNKTRVFSTADEAKEWLINS